MQIVLIYPPPWKIPRPGHSPDPQGPSAPKDPGQNVLTNNSFLQAPTGLLSIAAQAMHAGHEVTVLNLSNACWTKVASIIQHQPAAVYGLSCMTANRRGVFATADLIRATYPDAHITVGGPHVTALPVETLDHCHAIDTVVTGEGEATFMAVVDRLSAGKAASRIPGTVWREGDTIRFGPPRAPLEHLDDLAAPLHYFPMHTVTTSRGCPGNCTFCSSDLMWGRRSRFHSVAYILDMLETAVVRHGQKIIAIEDDTFTADRRRVLALCDAIRERQMDFVWSCQTRADCLDEDVLLAMRRAGCQRISIGVESASPEILKNIRKRISPAMVRRVTRWAQDVGLRVRYYLMVGNRGETFDTFQESLAFIQDARPNQYVFSQLHLYPGTTEFDIFCRNGILTPEIYFERDFSHLTCFAGKTADADRIFTVLKGIEGVQDYYEPGIEELRRAAELTGNLPAAYLDLCSALIENGRLQEAETRLCDVVENRYCLQGLVYNCRACIAAARGSLKAACSYLDKAMSCYPHQVVVDNLVRLSSETEAAAAAPVRLDPRIRFETTFLRYSPEFPDPDPVLDPTADAR